MKSWICNIYYWKQGKNDIVNFSCGRVYNCREKRRKGKKKEMKKKKEERKT